MRATRRIAHGSLPLTWAARLLLIHATMREHGLAHGACNTLGPAPSHCDVRLAAALLQAAVCIGFSAGVIWRVRAAPPGRDEERPLLDAAEGEAPRPAQRTRVLLQCAAVTLFGGMAAGLVGLVRGPPSRFSFGLSDSFVLPVLANPAPTPITAQRYCPRHCHCCLGRVSSACKRGAV